MTDIARRGTPEAPTSAVGAMHRAALNAAPATVLIATTLPEPATTSTYAQGLMIAPCAERTTTGPIGQIEIMPAQSTADAIFEIRRRFGLNWEELGDLFEVSRRCVNHWANGKPATARFDRMIHRMLAAARHLDRGDRARTRALLLAVDEAVSVSTFDLLRGGRFDEAMGRVESIPAPERRRIPLSSAAADARRPPAPVLLLDALQERPKFPAKARTVRPWRKPTAAG